MKKISMIKKGIAGILATAVLAAGVGFYEVQEMKEAVEVASFVDPELSSVLEEEETPLASAPKTTTKTTTKTTKKTTTSKKNVTLKTAATKTYTKTLPTTTKKSSKTVKKNSTTTEKTDTTVQTYTTENYTKKSKKKVVNTKVVTTTKVTTTVKVTTSSTSTAAVKTLNVDSAASKIDSRVRKAYKALGFKLTVDPKVSYSGYFSAKTKSITLRTESDVVYHELGHFLAFIAGNYDTSAAFKAVYNAEKSKYTGYNKAYVLQNSSEYFAESVRDYTLNPSALKKARPKTYAAIQTALSKVTDAQIAKYRLILSAL